MQKCPGQDTRFWTPDDVTEVSCASCGYEVEFFKTDGARACPQCGANVTNPHQSLGCAQWCAHARECLGFDPAGVQVRSAAQSSLAERLVKQAKEVFGADSPRVKNAISALEKVGGVLRERGGDPKIVVARSFFDGLNLYNDEENSPDKAVLDAVTIDLALIKRLMTAAGFDAPTIESVCKKAEI